MTNGADSYFLTARDFTAKLSGLLKAECCSLEVWPASLVAQGRIQCTEGLGIEGGGPSSTCLPLASTRLPGYHPPARVTPTCRGGGFGLTGEHPGPPIVKTFFLG